ncbi:coiled-coil domain-containing protein 113-like [Amyelois transitella]|uniref:coiled-coil domain-containing protein 113-like n=1 Tax=Amyelois transitella TaxID=680683 RepID=UPI00298F6026|nr:coiled-coil domain-containing protein 113-like [Amyelois transitella]
MLSQITKSTASHNSRSLSRLFTDTDELTDDELIKQVNELKKQIKILTLENEIIERTIMRVEPSLMHGVQQALEYALKLQSNSSLNVGSFVRSQASRVGGLDSFNSPSRTLAFSSPSRISTRKFDTSSAKLGGTIIFGSGPRVNVIERSELVTVEMEILINNLENARMKAARKHALLKAEIEEIKLREADIDKASVMFNQEVIVGGWDKIAQRIPAEIWIRFMTEWVKICDSKIGKLRLRTSTLNTQYSKLNGQIRVKTELSESLRAVDFEKLKIENGESEKLIDYKMQQLIELKKMTGDANLTLTIHKKAMMDQNNYLSNIIKSIKTREKLIVELDKERDKIQVQADSLDLKLSEVKKVRLAYEVPDVMDYVKVKAEVADLKHSVKVLENRVHIYQIALASLNKQLMSLSSRANNG